MSTGEEQLIPYTASLPEGARRVLVLAPHPDDEVFGCGGTLALLAQQGAAVRVVIATDSTWGSNFPDGADRAAVRRAESEAAAHVLGYGAPVFWGLPDRGLQFDEALVAPVAAALRESAADLLLAPAPREIHPDHHALGLAALEAARRHGGALRVWLYEISAPMAPNRLVDISAVRARKGEAMRAFTTQLAMRRYDARVDALNQYRSYTVDDVDVAEAFHEIEAGDLQAGVRSVIDRISAPAERQAAAVPPLVSVIVRSMDRPSLREALDSIAAQTYRWIEIVVVDADGAHGALPASWGGLPLRLVSRGQALSRPAAANAGLAAARGDWLLFVDDDDLLLGPHLERLVAAAGAGGPLTAPYAGVQVVDASGAQVDVYDYPDAAVRLPAHNPFPIHAVLFARLWVDAGLRFDESLPVFEDWDFWLQLGTRARFVHVPGVSAIYRAALGDSGLSLDEDAAAREAGRRTVIERWSNRLRPEQFEQLLAQERVSRAQAQADAARESHRANDLQSQMLRWQELLEQERTSRAQAQADAARESHRANDLQSQIGQWQRLLEQEREQARALTAALEAASASAAREGHRADDLHSQIGQWQQLLEQEREQAAVLTAALEAATSQAHQFAGERDAAAALAQQLAAERDASAAQAQQLAAERDAAQVALHDLHNSHSWRVTAPLRATADWIRALRRRGQSRTALAAPPVTAPPPSAAAAKPPTAPQRRTVALLLSPASFDASAIRALLERLPSDVRICVPAPSGRIDGGADARVHALVLPAQARLDEQITALRAAVPGANVVVVADGAPIPDEATIAALVEPFARSTAIGSVSAAATGADVLGVAIPAEMALALSASPWPHWPQHFALLGENWPGPRGGVVALRFEALRDLGAPRDLESGLARWAEWTRGFGWAHAVAPVRIVGAHDQAPAVRFMREAAVSVRWARYLAEPAIGDAAREMLFEQLLFSRQSPVLVLDHNLGGGANRYRAKRIAQWLAEDRPVLLFHDDLYNDTTVAVLHHPQAGEWQRSGFDISALLTLAAQGRWSEIFFNNAAHARDPLAVPALLLRLKETTRAPLTVAIHDFYSVCPAYVLLTDEARHCGVPEDVAVCERCLASNRFDPHQGSFAIRDWRAAWGPAIEAADSVLTFNSSGARLMARAYPAIAARTRVEPHEVPPWPPGTTVPIDFSSGLRIGIVGSLSEAKGSAIVGELAEEVARRGLAVPVVLIGQLTDRKPSAGLTCTGMYRAEQLPRLLAAHRVNCCLFPSICPETFSYVLSELMQLDLPICAFGLGAQGERVREYPRGLVVTEVSAAAALDAMLAFAARQTGERAAQ